MTNAPVQAFSWADLDGDGVLDLVMFGSEVRIHYGNDTRAPNSPRVQIDCNPLAVNPPVTCVGTDIDVVGTPVFTANGTQLAISIDDGTRNLYRVDFSGKTAALRPAILSQTCAGGTGTTCAPIRAIVARDVDGDHQLDLIAIDAALVVYVRFANGTITTIQPPAALPTTNFKVVRASVSGAVR
jgi:hypothetical protein